MSSRRSSREETENLLRRPPYDQEIQSGQGDEADDGDQQDLMNCYYEGVNTMYQGFFKGRSFANSSGDSRAFGTRPRQTADSFKDLFVWISYDQILERAEAISSNLISRFSLPAGQETLVGILSVNCPEWMIVAIGCYLHSWIVVPLYQTATDDALAHICVQCSFKVCFVKTGSDAKRLINLKISGKSMAIERIVIFDAGSFSDELSELARRSAIDVMSLDDLEQSGSLEKVQHTPPGPDDLIVVCYTSGTTGTPKGVMLTHANMISTIACQADWLQMICEPAKEYYLSYLPLNAFNGFDSAHILEFSLENLCLCSGYKIGYYSGNVKDLSTDISLLRPTLFAAVPRVMNRIFAGIKSKTAWRQLGLLKYLLFKLAYYSKLKQLTKAASNRDRFVPPSLSTKPKSPPPGWLSTKHISHSSHWTDRIFEPIRAQFGGRLKIVLVGSSASLPEILLYMKVVMGCPVIEGYGQTECCGASHTQPFFDMTVGNVGRPIRSCQMKLVDVPDVNKQQQSNYGSSQPAGELCLKGNNVFKGYYKDREATSKVLDEDGWLHTGDIATIDSETGVVSIVDRKNEIFKLSQGEYIVPSKIENAYAQCDVVQHCLVYGEPIRNYTVAIIVPEKDVLLKYAYKQELISKSEMVAESTFSRICQNQAIIQLVLTILNTQATLSQLSGVERVKRIYLHPEPLTCEQGLLTPTMKMRRNACIKYFRKEIDKLYRNDSS